MAENPVEYPEEQRRNDDFVIGPVTRSARMSTGGTHPAAVKAATDFDRHEGRSDGAEIAVRLAKNLTALRESLFRCVLTPDKSLSLDSMLLPASKLKAQQQAAEEVEAFMIAESAEAVRLLELVKTDETWYVDWLTALRLDAWNPLGNVPERIGSYLKQSGDERRLQFSNLLVEAIPETRRAPLVLFRLLPTAVHLTTALAFGDSKAAEKIRAEQIKILPSIAYCQQCHGELLADGKECSTCGNPLWNNQWLSEID